jgi:polyisoprenoid-binding protein YceI
MQKILIFILIIVVIGIAFVLLRPQKAPTPELTPAPEEAAVVESGTYTTTEGSTVTWQGRRPLMEGYMDSGTINVSAGTVVVADESVTGNFSFNMETIQALNTGKGDGQDMLTEHLQSEDFFDVAQYPQARLSITSVTETGREHEYTAEGSLTMKEMTNPISFPVTAYMENGNLRIQGNVSVDRTVWNIEYGSGKFFDNLADKVIDDFFTVGIDLTLVR